MKKQGSLREGKSIRHGGDESDQKDPNDVLPKNPLMQEIPSHQGQKEESTEKSGQETASASDSVTKSNQSRVPGAVRHGMRNGKHRYRKENRFQAFVQRMTGASQSTTSVGDSDDAEEYTESAVEKIRASVPPPSNGSQLVLFESEDAEESRFVESEDFSYMGGEGWSRSQGASAGLTPGRSTGTANNSVSYGGAPHSGRRRSKSGQRDGQQAYSVTMTSNDEFVSELLSEDASTYRAPIRGRKEVYPDLSDAESASESFADVPLQYQTPVRN